MISRRAFAVAVLLLSGCDQLFPEFAGSKGDLAVSTDGGADLASSLLHGSVCRLSDLRTPTSCTATVPNRVVTIAETGATTTTASDGTFSFPTVGTTVTLVVSDPVGSAPVSTPTISMLSGGTLTAARTHGVELPIIDADAYEQVELANGVGGDPSRGAVLGWVISSSGSAVAGAVATPIASATGPLYDTSGGLETGARSGSFGTVAFFDLAPGTSTIIIAAPSGSSLGGDTFSLPIRPGAVTTSALMLPPG
ncbi:MAG: hypothetical protein ABI321_10380 [Polyangia bacterium]